MKSIVQAEQHNLTSILRQSILDSIEQDEDLDVWRTHLMATRTALLAASHTDLLAVCELLLRTWLRSFLQARIIDVSNGEAGELFVLTPEEVEKEGQHLEAIIDTAKPPQDWKLGKTLRAQLNGVVDYIGDGHGAPGFVDACGLCSVLSRLADSMYFVAIEQATAAPEQQEMHHQDRVLCNTRAVWADQLSCIPLVRRWSRALGLSCDPPARDATGDGVCRASYQGGGARRRGGRHHRALYGHRSRSRLLCAVTALPANVCREPATLCGLEPRTSPRWGRCEQHCAPAARRRSAASADEGPLCTAGLALVTRSLSFVCLA